MIAIYSTQDSPRLRFAFDFVFKQYFNSAYQLFQNVEDFSSQNGFKINYSVFPISCDLQIIPTNSIFENDIKPLDISCFEWNETKAFFKTSENEIPFDIFFAIFFLLSRYEEYLPHKEDAHGRYISTESILFKNKTLDKPIVNIWLFHFAEILKGKNTKTFVPKFKFIPTLDIDQFYYFKHKEFKRQVGSLLKDFIKLKWKSAIDKKLIWLGLKPDFYDNSDEIIALHKRFKEKKIFVLSIDKTTAFDKNINALQENSSSKKNMFKENVLKYAKEFLIGIHPSYYSFLEEKNVLKKEINLLENALGKEVRQSRQHFLKLNIPETYRQLIQQKIEMDHTMGYAENIGYRAGVAFPFYFFDVEKNEETKLQILPFMMMDVSFKNYLKVNSEQAKITIEDMLKTAQKYGGVYSSIWHNESLSEHGEWKNWKQVYTFLLEKI